MLSEMKQAASDRSRPASGTALNLLDGIFRAADYEKLGLHDLSEDDIVAYAIRAASDINSGLNVRLPAFQVAARHHSPQILVLARQILTERSAQTPIMLLQSACSVIGQLGNPEDRNLLQATLDQGNPHVRPAALAAIAAVQKRNS